MPEAQEQLSMRIGSALYQLRKMFKLSQSGVVEVLQGEGINIKSQSVISDYELGRKIPSPETIEAYSKGFNADIRFVWGSIKTYLPREIEFDFDDRQLETALNRLKQIDPVVYDDVKDNIINIVAKRTAVEDVMS